MDKSPNFEFKIGIEEAFTKDSIMLNLKHQCKSKAAAMNPDLFNSHPQKMLKLKMNIMQTQITCIKFSKYFNNKVFNYYFVFISRSSTNCRSSR